MLVIPLQSRSQFPSTVVVGYREGQDSTRMSESPASTVPSGDRCRPCGTHHEHRRPGHELSHRDETKTRAQGELTVCWTVDKTRDFPETRGEDTTCSATKNAGQETSPSKRVLKELKTPFLPGVSDLYSRCEDRKGLERCVAVVLRPVVRLRPWE